MTIFFRTNRAGELNSDELERIVTIMQNPAQFKIPTWFLNRRKDITEGKNLHVVSNQVDSKLRDDIERLKKIRSHRYVCSNGISVSKRLQCCISLLQRSPTLLELEGTRSAHLYHRSTIRQDRRRQEEVNGCWKVDAEEIKEEGNTTPISLVGFGTRFGGYSLPKGFLFLVMLSFDVMLLRTTAQPRYLGTFSVAIPGFSALFWPS